MTFTHEIGKILNPRKTPPETINLLRKTLPQHNKWTAPTIKHFLDKGCNAFEASKVLGVTQHVFQRLRSAGELKVVVDGGSVNKHQIIDLSGSEYMAESFADRTGIPAICEQSGLTRHGVEQLCCLGLLVTLSETFMTVSFDDKQVSLTSWQSLCADLEAKSTLLPTADSIPLHQAMKVIGGREKPWGVVISKILNGDIPVQIDAGEHQLTKRIHVRKSDLGQISILHFDETQFPDFEFATCMSGRDMETLLNIVPKHTVEALKNQIIVRAPKGGFEKAEVLEIARTYISAGEILMRWGSRKRKMPEIFSRWNGLQRLNCLGWSRAEAEKYMRDNPRQILR